MKYFFHCLSGTFCCYVSFLHLMPDSFSNLQKITVFLYFLFFSYYVAGFINQWATFFMIFGAILLLVRFTHKDYYRISCALFGWLYMVTANYLLLWLASLIFLRSQEQLLSVPSFYFPFNLFFIAFCFITTRQIGRFINQKLLLQRKISDPQILRGIGLYLAFLTSFFILYVAYEESAGYSYGITAFSSMFFLLLFIGFIFLIGMIADGMQEIERNRQLSLQFDSLQAYTRKLEESYGTMRRLKHDYTNLFAAMARLLAEDNLDELKSYFEKQILPFHQKFSQSAFQLNELEHVNFPALKALLSSKLIYAMEAGLHTSIEIREPIQEPGMDTMGLIRTLGIFLDNAIEAALESEQKELQFSMQYQEQALRIIIRNTTQPLPFPVHELNALGISSKGESRGIGLYNVSVILESCPNVVWDTAYEPPWFSQQLTIYP